MEVVLYRFWLLRRRKYLSLERAVHLYIRTARVEKISGVSIILLPLPVISGNMRTESM
jgi:hypothetical protein